MTDRLQAPLKVERLSKQGTFAGYGSVFNIMDTQKDIIQPGAFREGLDKLDRAGSMPKMLWQHRYEHPIGVWHFIEEDARGLYVEGKLLLDVQQAREAYALIKAGALDGLSIGYRVVEAHKNAQKGIREITKIDLLEVSIVTFAANPSAKITKVKHHDKK